MVASHDSPQSRSPFGTVRIVGIGASAGGLSALEQFFAKVPTRSGLAFVVVQHLDPTAKSLLPELLQRITAMQVHEAVGMMRIESDCVYVIAPNSEVSVADGVLKVGTPIQPRGMRLPINVLFSSLAREQGERSVGVILSGMGSDGTLGLQSIKALGGLTAVQEPESAQFDSMPSSAIAAGCADIVAPPGQLPGRLLAYISRTPGAALAGAAAAEPPDKSSDDAMRRVFELLRSRSGHDFSNYKPNSVRRRIERRMAIHAIAKLEKYEVFLRENPQEGDFLFKELLIGVTRFFRDEPVWRQLADVTLPELLGRQGEAHNFRAWIVGCSTGEEAYSLAIVFAEVLERLPQYRGRSLQIFASDLSADAVAAARRGEYSASIHANVSPDRLKLFFNAEHGHFRVNKRIRDMVLFAQHDVILDPPFTKLDLISCRNLMIYFDSELQGRLLPLFHYSLRSGGLLLLGNAESVGRFNRLFSPIDAKLRLYSRQDTASHGAHDFQMKPFPPLSKSSKDHSLPSSTIAIQTGESLQLAADQLLLQVYASPAVVVNQEGDIVYLSGRTGRYLEPAAGKANWNFHAMIREGLRSPLARALVEVAGQREPLQLRGLRVEGPGGAQLVDVTVHAMLEPPALQGMVMVVFRDVLPPTRRGRRKGLGEPDALPEADLQQYLGEIHALREETRASREELQATNEELQSTNEELQSTNEELTTSKEEMQSMNEELQTINAEMQTKLDDLALAQGDLKNLLNSTDIAMLFLDKDLNVRRYTDRALKIFNLLERDVGRPLSDLSTSLRYPTLNEDVRETVRTLVFSEKQILTSDGRWYSVRIMPYRTLEDVIDGAVITLVDITATKELESKLRTDSTN
jgi:two-component system CheB/CheR fusion protein